MLYRNILLAPDLQPGGESMIDYAFALGERAGAKVHAVYACLAPVAGSARDGEEEADQEAARQRAKQELLRAVERHHESPSMGKCIVDAREPVSAILKTAAAVSADLIIVSTHARHGMERLMVGSVAEGVLEEATVPVLVIAPPSR